MILPRLTLNQLFRQIEREVGRLAKDRSKTQGITRSWANYLKRTYEQKQDDFVTPFADNDTIFVNTGVTDNYKELLINLDASHP